VRRASAIAWVVAAIASANPSLSFAQDSVFNLPAFGSPASGVSMRGRGMGGAGLGLGGELFSLENPATAVGFGRAAAHLSFLGQTSDVEDRTTEGTVEGVNFPVGQIVIPAYSRSVLTLGFYQLLDFDAALDGVTVFEGDTVGVVFEAEGGVSVISPGVAWSLDDRTAVGATVDVYVGSREVVRGIDLSEIVNGAVATSDTLARDFGAVGLTFGVERRLGQRVQVSAAYKLRPTIESDVTRGLGKVEGEEGFRRVDVEIPDEIVLGAAGRVSTRLLAAATFRFAGWSGAEGAIGTEAGVDDVVELGGGIEFRPVESFLGIVGPSAPLRAGLRWRQLPIVLEGSQVTEWAVTGGYGRILGPDRRGSVDISLEIGRRGDLEDHGLTERFIRVGVGLSAFEPWRRGQR